MPEKIIAERPFVAEWRCKGGLREAFTGTFHLDKDNRRRGLPRDRRKRFTGLPKIFDTARLRE
jgi:hypothetical protein